MRIELPEIGVSNILDGFNNVYGLNGFASKLSKVELDKTRLYRYVKLEQFKENVKSNELVFVSPVSSSSPLSPSYVPSVASHNWSWQAHPPYLPV